jgi:hypothetical protein
MTNGGVGNLSVLVYLGAALMGLGLPIITVGIFASGNHLTRGDMLQNFCNQP